ncbi:putative transposable element, partial [Pseudoloma neurophilia]
MNKLRKLAGFNKSKWREYVQMATLSINLSFHRALGTSPFIWKEERQPELPFERKMNIQRIFVNKEEMIQKRQKIWQKYQKDIVKGKKFIDDSLEPGDSVFLYRPRQSKMQNGWQNGFKVIKGIGHDVFLVEKDGQI